MLDITALARRLALAMLLIHASCGAREVVRETHTYAPGLELEVFRPRARKPLPAILLIHGGAWREGDRSQMEWLAQALAARGFITVPVEYRLSHAAKFPAQLEDLRAAAHWVRTQPYVSQLTALGASAGGHLAAMLGVVGEVDGVVGLNPVLNLADPRLGAYARAAVVQLMPDSLPWTEASPFLLASSGAPPFLIVHGTDDNVAPFHQAQQMAARLRQHNVMAMLVPAPHATHGFYQRPKWRRMVIRQIVVFHEVLERLPSPPRNDSPE